MLKKYLLTAMVATCVITLAGCGAEEDKAASTDLTTQAQKESYVIGLNIARNMDNDGITVDVDAMTLAMNDVFNKAEPRLTEEEMAATMEAFQQARQADMIAMQEKAEVERQAAADTNLAAGEAFLAENGQKEGVVTLPSGLQYKEITAADGAKPAPEDTVTVHYRGKLLDGSEFDSSYSRNEPATFPLQRVIPGWTEGLQYMPVGSKYELYIPADLAYGPGGGGERIGPNETLIFEIELLDITKPEAPAADVK